MARWIILAGFALVVIGVILHFAPGVFGWFGRLPGDIRIENEKTRVYIPITSMILLSVGLTVLLNLFRR